MTTSQKTNLYDPVYDRIRDRLEFLYGGSVLVDPGLAFADSQETDRIDHNH